MNKFSTLNYLINSYYDGMRELNSLSDSESVFDEMMNVDDVGFEPSQDCLDAIINFALEYEVLKSESAGIIELHLN